MPQGRAKISQTQAARPITPGCFMAGVQEEKHEDCSRSTKRRLYSCSQSPCSNIRLNNCSIVLLRGVSQSQQAEHKQLLQSTFQFCGALLRSSAATTLVTFTEQQGADCVVCCCCCCKHVPYATLTDTTLTYTIHMSDIPPRMELQSPQCAPNISTPAICTTEPPD
jgi:hypothetical protein